MATKLQKKFDPDDLTGRMFKQAFADALAVCGGKFTELSRRLGLNSRCYYWAEHLPPYATMQEVYPKLLQIGAPITKERINETDSQALIERNTALLRRLDRKSSGVRGPLRDSV